MDPQSRQTASAYINNLLLSRGLLRNGQPVEFAKPEDGEGGLGGTMSQVMNLVHDLILRRDRDADHLATLSTTLSSLRSTTAAQTATITKLESRASNLDRQLALSTAQERSARATLRGAETRNRVLREEMARLKASVGQVRAQCAADLRRRDGEITRLKRHLEGGSSRRGLGKDGLVSGVVVVGGVSGRTQVLGLDEGDGGVDSLRGETTEFLTRLSQGLSEENDGLIGLVRGTLATLRSLQGLPEGDGEWGARVEDEGTVGGFMSGPPSVEALALSTDEVLEHLRGLLTNPSFVPLEEVEVREEEIQRLREGWEKMAVRWQEAMSLMDGWRKRVVDTGDTINLDDLKDGLKLGNGIPSAMEARVSPAKQGVELPNEDSSILQELQESHDGVPEDVPNLSDPLEEVELAIPTAKRALLDKSANIRPGHTGQKAPFPSIPEEKSHSLDIDDDISLLNFSREKQIRSSPEKKAVSRIPMQARILGTDNDVQALIEAQARSKNLDQQVQKKLDPMLVDAEQARPKSPEQTVQQKLDRAQAEAEEARKKEKRVKRDPVKRKFKGSRRRSTLSPEELENLVGAA